MVLQTKAARQYAIRELITSSVVSTQDELRALLAKRGLAVTQATLSRDLDEMRAVKRQGARGTIAYSLPDEEGVFIGGEQVADSLWAKVAADAVLAIDSSANLVVVRTKPGAAQYLASAVDRCGLSEVLGSVAGDDTIMVISRSADGGERLANALSELMQRS
jgi:transcriptional regulator of arginine metabolism